MRAIEVDMTYELPIMNIKSRQKHMLALHKSSVDFIQTIRICEILDPNIS